MHNLTEKERQKIIQLIQEGKPIPSIYKNKLFNEQDVEYIEATKDYKLVYKGKARKEDIIANTPAAPLQKIRTFNSENKFDDDWSNMLIFGDNLLALKAIYEDQQGPNIYKTKNKIKLIYIDPPFATKQDFMKDREKAYRDKIIGAQFIEFLRKRLILLREILADDGSIYVHLDQKKGHYIKATLDEIFGEHNFKNEIFWKRTFNVGSSKGLANKFPVNTDTIYWYTKNESYIYNRQYRPFSLGAIKRYDKEDENGRFMWVPLKTVSEEKLKRLRDSGEIREEPGLKYPRYKKYLDEDQGVTVDNAWDDIGQIATRSEEGERENYPTQKPENLLNRIINVGSNKGDIILDCFAGSGTTISVSEKLKRKWIGIDSSKLSIYTTQKRILNLNDKIYTSDKNTYREFERVLDFHEHSMSNSRALFMTYDTARNKDLIINDEFLKIFADFISDNLSGNKEEEISLICHEERYKISELEVIDTEENEDDAKAGEKTVKVGRVKFLISFIQPKEKQEKPKPLKAKEFTLYHCGIYDNELIKSMSWESYKPFVAQLFSVRLSPHKIHSLDADGYIGTSSAFIWDYPNHPNHILDEEYVETLHEILGGKAGNTFYIIAPVCSMGFMQDEIIKGETSYTFLKVPLSVLMAIIEKGEPGALKQPVSENDVNEVIDAVGFDFISQPIVKAKYKISSPKDKDLLNHNKKELLIEISEFRSNTLAYDPEDFENFDTLSMVIIDTDYNGKYFNLTHVFWADKIINEEKTKAEIRIPEDEVKGKKLMIIYMDKYGNEFKKDMKREAFK